MTIAQDNTSFVEEKTVEVKGENFTIYDIYQVAFNDKTVTLNQEQLDKVDNSFNLVQEWGMAKYPIYGVNTGFGELINRIIPPQFKSELQSNLLRSHAAGGGNLFPEPLVRAIMAARLNCLMKGHSGVSPDTLKLITELINRHIHPLVPQQGSLGASGDLAPLSHLALPLIGTGYVHVDGEVRKSDEALTEQGLQPRELGFKEGLALVNGTSAMTGVASIALVRAYKLLQLALLASADFIQCLRGSTRPFAHEGHQLKNHSGQIMIARILRKLLADSELTYEHNDMMEEIYKQTSNSNDVVETEIFLQNAYTLRCTPQILGPVLETLNFARRLVEEEINSCNDNPLIFARPEETFHGGNFHGQYVAMSCDYLNIALTEIGVLAERQLNRLVDPHLNNHLPDFLAKGQTGLFCGFEGAQYLATSIASENLDLAAPASIKSIPSNGSNQDVVSMGLIAARKSIQLTENITNILSVLVAACHQASYLMGQEKFNSPVQALHNKLSEIVPLYQDDTPISELIAKTREFLTSEEGWALLDEQVNLFEGEDEMNVHIQWNGYHNGHTNGKVNGR